MVDTSPSFYQNCDWCLTRKYLVSIFQCSALADDGLAVVAGNVVEPDSVSVEVVEDSNTELIPLSVVWLRSTSSER